MSTFYGTESCVIDAKGRIVVPSRMRRGLQPDAHDTFVLVRGLDGCVSMYPLDEWRKVEDKLREMPMGSEKARMFKRLLLETAHETVMDGQGRISLTGALSEHAGVDGEAKLIGAFDHIELWNAKRYESRTKDVADQFEKLATDLLT
jgi:MraZ protein